MPTGEQFATNVPQTFLASPVAAAATSIPVLSSSSWPATPFTAIFGIGTSLQEAIHVTNVSGTTWTATRGYDGTVAQNQPLNQTITHGTIGLHFRELRSHIDASGPTDASSESVHGLLTGQVVGTSESQTLTNKALTAPTISGTVGGGATYSSPTITTATFSGNQAMGSGAWSGTGNITMNWHNASGKTGATNNPLTISGGTNGGPPTTGTFAVGDIVFDVLYGIIWGCTGAGTPGTWKPLNGTVLANTLSLSGVNTVTATLPTVLTPYFNNMRIVFGGSTSSAGVDFENLRLRFNGDTAANYCSEYTGLLSTGVQSNLASAADTSMIVGLSGGSLTAGARGNFVIDVPFYKTAVTLRGAIYNGEVHKSVAATTSSFSVTGAGAWSGAAAITSVTLLNQTSGTWSANSSAEIWLTV